MGGFSNAMRPTTAAMRTTSADRTSTTRKNANPSHVKAAQMMGVLALFGSSRDAGTATRSSAKSRTITAVARVSNGVARCASRTRRTHR